MNIVPEDWREICNCGGINLAGFVTAFIHARKCPLYSYGVQEWAKLKLGKKLKTIVFCGRCGKRTAKFFNDHNPVTFCRGCKKSSIQLKDNEK